MGNFNPNGTGGGGSISGGVYGYNRKPPPIKGPGGGGMSFLDGAGVFGKGFEAGGGIGQYFGGRSMIRENRRAQNAANAMSGAMIARLTGASTPHAINVNPGNAQFLVKAGSPESKYLPVGSMMPGASELGISRGIFDARKKLFGMLTRDAVSKGDINAMAGNANRTAAAGVGRLQARGAQDLSMLADFGQVGGAGAQQRMQAGAANAQFRNAVQSSGTNFIGGINQLAASTI